ncbi:MAG: metallophosphoesterase [Sandaracinaceae bacterium]|nr:metallophosphoesterase [Sandaracinaceae bacterium]
MRVLHVSDVHVDVPFADMPVTGWASPKRLLGGANLALRRKRRFRDAVEKLRLLGDLCDEQRVDLVICTGDYTALGTEPELRAARAAIEPLTRCRFGLVTVPGNHDVYVPDAVGRFERIFGDLLEPGPWPKVRIVDDSVAVVAVDSTRPNPQPWRSSGRIPDAQLEALPSVLASLGDRFVFVITHYAPRLASGRPDRFTHGLVNADHLLAACAGLRGAILHGHVHRTYRVRVEGVMPELFCAGSTTEKGREGLWLFEVDGEGLRATQGSFEGGRYRLRSGS